MSNAKPKLIVTIDVERDYDSKWQIPSNLSYNGVIDVLPNILNPLFDNFGIKPTYFLGAEIIGSKECVDVLHNLNNCEFGTHLHSEYIPPFQTKHDFASADLHIIEMQCEYSKQIERDKLATLTELFHQQFGYKPTSFRAGRFGISHFTGSILLELGYHVDSSVSPHMLWTTQSGEKKPDFRRCNEFPYFVSQSGDIWKKGKSPLLEVPITIFDQKYNNTNKGQPLWFRPWYSNSDTLKRIIELTKIESISNNYTRPLVMMFHNVELVPGASPYPQTHSEVSQYIGMLKTTFDYAIELGYEPCTLEEYYTHLNSLTRNEQKNANSLIIDNSPAFNRNLSINQEIVINSLEFNQVQPWFKYIFTERETRWDIYKPSTWIAKNISPNKNILETACGVGFNLFWLAELGYTNLFGFDIDPKAIRAGYEISEYSKLPLSIWVDDGISPHLLPPKKYSCILGLNWTFLIENYSLKVFLKTYIPVLEDDGVLIFDIIDASYDSIPDNEYLSSDIFKPVNERQSSEYKFRLSLDQVKKELEVFGLTIIEIITEEQKIPKFVYIASRVSSEKINKANPIKVNPKVLITSTNSSDLKKRLTFIVLLKNIIPSSVKTVIKTTLSKIKKLF